MTDIAVASPSEPGPEWGGITGHHGWRSWHQGEIIDCPECHPIRRDETPYRDTGARDEYVSAWQQSRDLHR